MDSTDRQAISTGDVTIGETSTEEVVKKLTHLFDTDSRFNRKVFAPTGEWEQTYDELRESMGYERLFDGRTE